MSRTSRVIRFLFWRRTVNTLRRLRQSPAQLLPILILTPGVILGVMIAVGVLLIPPYDAAWAEDSKRFFTPFTDNVRSIIMVLLLAVALSLIHRALEEDLLAFRQSELDFLFPAPISLPQILLARMATDYLFCALTTFTLVLYVLAPMRIVMPSTAGRGWALATWLGVMLFYISATNLGRLVQAALSAGKWSGLAAAKWLRFFALGLSIALLVELLWDRAQGREPFESAIDLLTSRLIYWAFLPCGLVADMFVAPLSESVNLGGSLAILLATAVISGAAVLALTRPAFESALAATQRRHAIWQAFRKADASSIRAAQLAGRTVRGNPYGLPRLGSGSWALVAKSLVYGIRSSPWGLIIVALLAVAPLGVVPLMEGHERLEGVMPYMPVLMLALVFAWSQRVRLNVREEFSHLSVLKSLPLSPFSMLLALLVVPAGGFSLFLIVSGSAVAESTSLVNGPQVYSVLSIAPALYTALGSVHVCSGLLYPSYDPGLSKGYVADLALTPVAILVFLLVAGSAAGALALTGAVWAAAVAGNLTGIAATCVGLGVAGFLYDRFEP